jgi:hypothetical protein
MGTEAVCSLMYINGENVFKMVEWVIMVKTLYINRKTSGFDI